MLDRLWRLVVRFFDTPPSSLGGGPAPRVPLAPHLLRHTARTRLGGLGMGVALSDSAILGGNG